ncbi:MAG TPA: hypothetical protein PL196_05105, partial [Burkholderiaceae bacterium]|nr:hypothetical protein [Burkholderiaceae bacterium]
DLPDGPSGRGDDGRRRRFVMASLEAHRRFHAELIVRSFGSGDPRLIDAFAAVPREDFVGPGPWLVATGDGYIPTVSTDPALLYQDIVIGLAPERRINNGQPSFHAEFLAEAAPALGEHVVHVGAGTGYYSAVLATLVGPAGRVDAFEIEPDLAARATESLRGLPNVSVHAVSAVTTPLPSCDVLYVNAGATHPPPSWLDALQIGGRMILPLTPNDGVGIVLKITRVARDGYEARAIRPVAFVPCIGARDDEAAASLAAALDTQPTAKIRTLRRGEPPGASVWCAGRDWWLSTQNLEPDAP